MNRRTKIIVSVAGIFIVLLALLGITYAYFLTKINGNTNDKSISVSTANLELTYGDNSAEILGSGKMLQPSDEPIGIKTFTVTNNGETTNYSVVLENMSIKNVSDNTETEFYSNDFVYTLTCKTKSGSSCSNETSEQTVFPLSDGALINNDISKSDVHTYTLTLWYLETDVNQSTDMNKILNAKLNIIDPNRGNPYRNNKKLLAYNIINNSINRINGTEFRTTPLTTPSKEVSGFEYVRRQDSDSFPQKLGLYNRYISYASDYTLNKKTGKFTLGTDEAPVTTIKYTSSSQAKEIAGKYYVSSTTEEGAKKYYNLNNLTKITPNVSEITTSTVPSVNVWANKKSIENILSITTDDYGDSYYYRGNPRDNYLELNNICFRAVRIEGDGSIKLTLAKEGTCSSINSADYGTALINNSSRVVYGYDYDETNYTFNYEGYDGTNGLFVNLNNWYNANLSSVEDKLKKDLWCLGEEENKYDYSTGLIMNEEDLANQLTSNGYNEYFYETTKRLWLDKTPTYKCSDKSSEVTSYVGSLTADEVVFAGGKVEEANMLYYLYDNTNYPNWVLSRASFYKDKDEAFWIHTDGNLHANLSVSETAAARPAITLLAGTEIESGDGTQSDPYKIK